MYVCMYVVGLFTPLDSPRLPVLESDIYIYTHTHAYQCTFSVRTFKLHPLHTHSEEDYEEVAVALALEYAHTYTHYCSSSS